MDKTLSQKICTSCLNPFVPVQRGECSDCGSDAGVIWLSQAELPRHDPNCSRCAAIMRDKVEGACRVREREIREYVAFRIREHVVFKDRDPHTAPKIYVRPADDRIKFSYEVNCLSNYQTEETARSYAEKYPDNIYFFEQTPNEYGFVEVSVPLQHETLKFPTCTKCGALVGNEALHRKDCW